MKKDSLSINFVRHAFSKLMLKGSTLAEHLNCLKESRTLLLTSRGISDRVRRLAQNIPATKSRSGTRPKINIPEFWSSLDRTSLKVLLNWYERKLRNDELITVEAAVKALEGSSINAVDSDEQWDDAPGEEIYTAWRTLLKNFCVPEASEDVLSFLESQIPGVPRYSKNENDLSESDNKAGNIEKSEGFDESLNLIRDLKAYDLDAFTRKLKALDIDKNIKSLIQEFYGVFQGEISRLHTTPLGSEVHTFDRSPAVTVTDLPLGNIIGRVEKKRNKSDFDIRVLGYFKARRLYIFSQMQLKQFFAGGKIHSSARVDGEFEEGEVSLWQLRLNQNSGGPDRFSVVRREDRCIEVIEIPVKLDDTAAIRNWILNSYEGKTGVYPIFKTIDGTYIAHPKFLSQYDFDDFSSPFSVVDTIFVYKFEDGAVRAPASSCSFGKSINTVPIELRLRNYLKVAQRDMRDLPISDEQLSALNIRISHAKDYFADEERASCKAIIENLNEDNQFFEDIVQLLLGLPAVSDRLEALRVERLGDLDKEATSLREECRRLEIEREEKRAAVQEADLLIERETGKLSIQLDDKRRLLEDEFRKRVEEFSENELSVISKGLLYRTLFGLSSNIRNSDEYQVSNPRLDDQSTKRWASIRSLEDREAVEAALTLVSSGNKLLRPVLKSLVSNLVKGDMCVVAGRNVNRLVSAASELLAGGVVSTVYMKSDNFSLEDILYSPVEIVQNTTLQTMRLSDYLVSCQSVEIPILLRITGFNLIPPESYLSRFIPILGASGLGRSLVWTQAGVIRKFEVLSPIYLILEGTNGASTHPVGSDIAEIVRLYLSDAIDDEETGGFEIASNSAFKFGKGLIQALLSERVQDVFASNDSQTELVSHHSKLLGRSVPDQQDKRLIDVPALKNYFEAVKQRDSKGYFKNLFN